MSHSDLVKLVSKGPMQYCDFSQNYYHQSEMNRSETGGWIHQRFDTRIHNESVNQSKLKSGPDWQRGTK